MSKLKGKVAIVTGASKGIGASIAKHLAAEGAAVAVDYASSKEGADRVAAEIDRLFSETQKANSSRRKPPAAASASLTTSRPPPSSSPLRRLRGLLAKRRVSQAACADDGGSSISGACTRGADGGHNGWPWISGPPPARAS